MSLASRVVSLFGSNSSQDASARPQLDEGGSRGGIPTGHNPFVAKRQMVPEEETRSAPDMHARPPYIQCMLAGGVGGTTGDLLMHSLDTVKTRQQGDFRFPPKYTKMSSTYATIFRQEGLRRGLYGGVLPAFLGSFPGTVIFFGTYEYVKRHMIDRGINLHVAYLTGGLVADLAASVVYVPSEVLKTRLQLQGRYNNPFFKSGYNYRSSFDAVRTIIRQEGPSAMFHGYKATLSRDLPFSALQFAFYEQAQQWSRDWSQSPEIGLPLEVLTAASAGGVAGVITCPLDVVKTRVQTQHNPSGSAAKPALGQKMSVQAQRQGNAGATPRPARSASPMSKATLKSTAPTAPSVSKSGMPTLNTSSILKGLKLLYQAEGIKGWFRGVGPRFVWTSVQSTTMLVLYQIILRQFEGVSRVPLKDRVANAFS